MAAPPLNQGDAVSQLLQLAARKAKLEDFKWLGCGVEDVQQLVNYAKNQNMARNELWNTLLDILKHPQIKQLMEEDETFSGLISAHILRARACIDLQNVFNTPPNVPA